MSKVLVVEDDPRIRIALTVRLRAAGLDPVAVSDGAHAGRIAIDEQPDVILLDISMPGKHGFDVARELRAEPATAKAPIVFITASNRPELPQMAMELGGSAFVRKPYDVDILLATIRTALQESAA